MMTARLVRISGVTLSIYTFSGQLLVMDYGGQEDSKFRVRGR